MERGLISYCAPTLAGLKTGSIFNIDITDIDSKVEDFNKKYNEKGIYAAVLVKRGSTALLYVYRKKRLAKDLCRPECSGLMRKFGYCMDCNMCIEHLKERLSHSGDFPHEIGLFLSYPVEDVMGFIKNKGRNALMCGCWKVYGNIEKAEKQFSMYRKCTYVYSKLFNEGRKFEKFIVRE